MRLLATLALSLLQAQAPEALTVEVESLDGETWCTVRAENVPLLHVLTQLGDKLEVEVVGTEAPELATPVTIDMRRHPIARVLDASAGMVGLRVARRGTRWTIQNAVSAQPSADELRDLAMVSYLRASRSFPNHPEAANAEMSQGQIQMARGNHSAAKDHFDNVVRSFPDSGLIPQALMLSGEMLQELGDWSQAAKRYEDLLQLKFASEYESRARLELARCNAEAGEWQRSLFILDALEARTPPHDEVEGQDRILIRAKALVRAQEYDQAIERLAEMSRFQQTPEQEIEALRLRATSLERLGSFAESGRAWLALVLRTEGEAHAQAKAKAAELALRAGDDLGALLVTGARIDGEATEEDERLLELGRKAIERLGLDSQDPAQDSDEMRARRGESLIEEQNYLEAIAVLRPLTEDAGDLDETRRVDVLLAYATCVENVGGVPDVVRFLRVQVPQLVQAESRRRIYLFAAEMFERNQMLDEAVNAYRGRL